MSTAPRDEPADEGRLSIWQATWHPRTAVVLHDLVMVWVAWTSVHWLRYQLLERPPEQPLWPAEMPLVLIAQAALLFVTGLYRGLWRFASLPDLWNIIRASVYGTLLISLLIFFTTRLEAVPRSVFILYPLLLSVLLGAPRLLFRLWKDHGLAFRSRPGQTRVLMLGAGATGDLLARDLPRQGNYYLVGFLDDERRLAGRKLRGLPVFGSIDRLAGIVRQKAIDLVVIAIPSASNVEMQRIVELCEDAGVTFRTVPRINDLMSGKSTIHELKDVAIEDLLGRDPATLDWDAIEAGLKGKPVLVSGGGGSIGGELCRQIARIGPSRLAVLERSEHALYEIERELRDHFPDLLLTPLLTDVCDAAAVDYAIEQFQPAVIFHAAAYKHVPMLEGQIREAVRNNILGTRELALAANRHGVSRFVLISTDKAVNPVSVMGASKRAAESVCQSLAANSATSFVTVRFGNVLDSAGSVVPLFREQIRSGGPVTVTHPDVTRYFMTITEACKLIMQVASVGDSGEIYVLDMGEPIAIRYLAEQMIQLAGRKPHDDIEITFKGLRPGEKLREELFHDEERYRPTEHEQVLRALHRPQNWQEVQQVVAALDHACRELDEAALARSLEELVPEYSKKKTKAANIVPLPARPAKH
ncbi:MAG: nucleoside-diphosphate sugar epimerase/dehydratase [Pseudomonadota bacterium]